MSFVVLKFGGTSVAKKERWEVIREIALERQAAGFYPVVVCSAISNVSNTLDAAIQKIKTGKNCEEELQTLKDIHQKLLAEMELPTAFFAEDFERLQKLLNSVLEEKDICPKLTAEIMAQGEIFSTKIGALYFKSLGLPHAWRDAREFLLATEDPFFQEGRRYLSASCDYERDDTLRTVFQQDLGKIILTQGFIARNPQGETVLLGRGGSDTSAAYIAAKLGAARCEIWTDVPGMFTANPREVESAKILKHIDYDEAQEMATLGAKVLHPKTIPPLKKSKIPLHIKCTNDPAHEGTIVSEQALAESSVKCIATKKNVSLISIESLGMWQEVGFLADIFGIFKSLGLSVDLISTSETNVTITVDAMTNVLDPESVNTLLSRLSLFGKVQLNATCASVSLVGREIRSILHNVGPALSVFESQKVYLVSQAANDLNLSFVVQEDAALRLTRDLHRLFFETNKQSDIFGDRLNRDKGEASSFSDSVRNWWRAKRKELLQVAAQKTPAYVYYLDAISRAASELRKLTSIDRLFYAIKANDAKPILQRIYDLGFGFECVSVGELERVFELFPQLNKERVLFTPNFAPKSEYEAAINKGCHLTVDNLYILEKWPQLFRDQPIILRLDPGYGVGHHKHVKTAGEKSKFGISSSQIEKACELVEACGAKVVGLHVHAGSGIRMTSHWAQMAEFLMTISPRFKHLQFLNLGGGLDVASYVDDEKISLCKIENSLKDLNKQGLQFWMEPGRFLVANAGVVLAKVTQLKDKGKTSFVGIDAGMNSLLRPALYGAHHQIWNLTRLYEDPITLTHVVGPICESGDVLGHDVCLPQCREGDVILIETAGAYGRVMGSQYNRREPALEYFLND